MSSANDVRRRTFASLLMAVALLIGAWPAQGAICDRSVPKGISGIAGYYTVNDQTNHAIVSTDGDLFELFYAANGSPGRSTLARVPDTLAIAGYFAPLDAQRQVVIVARTNGEIHQVWFNPQTGIDSTLRGTVSNPVDVAGFYSYNTGQQHAVVAAGNGDIVELAWFPGQPVQRTTLTNIPGATHVSGFYAKDDAFNIVHVSDSAGRVWEIFYKNPTQVGLSVIATFNGPIVDLGSFFTDDDKFRHAIVGTGSGAIHEVFYHPLVGKGIAALGTRPGLRHLAAFASTETNRVRHVALALGSGEVLEMTFGPSVGIGNRFLSSFSRATPFAANLSVDTPNSQAQPFRGSSAGVSVAVAGDQDDLYTVSLNAGIWKAENNGPWRQLPSSPPLAVSLAVDPVDREHLIAGEREGNSAFGSQNRSGLWESSNGGAGWTYRLDPRALGCPGQAIASVAIDSASTMYAATVCGVARRRLNQSFELLTGTQGLGQVTVVTTRQVDSATWVWARTASRLLLSRDGGDNWSVITIPTSVSGQNLTWGDRGDDFSLAAFGRSAFTIVTAIGQAGKSGILTYDQAAGAWSLALVPAGSGVGLGGRRFVKSYDLPPGNGAPFALFAGAAQNVFLGVPVGGAIDWRQVAEAPWPGVRKFNPPSDIHTDHWDVHVGAGANAPVWLTSDGGVYRANFLDLFNTPAGSTTTPFWHHQNEGLHTHHVHTLSLITEGFTKRSKNVYSTSDNDEWERNSSPILHPEKPWRTFVQFGDSNGTHADNGSTPLAVIFRDKKQTTLTSFGDIAPFGAQGIGTVFAQYPEFHFNSNRDWDVIQTLKGEASVPLLDVVMLSKTPLNSPNAANVTVLIRSRRFAANPDFNSSLFSPPQWTIEDSNLPLGAQRVWASGGHTNPVYYLYAEDPGTGVGQLFRRDTAGAGWRQLAAGTLLSAPYLAVHGPAFVNPYDRNFLLVLTTAGVRVSRDGGFTFQDDPVLTALVTGSGKYPLTDAFPGGNLANIYMASRANEMSTLSNVTFFRDDPRKMAASSPYTGVFYRDETCGYWQDLTSLLPRPLAPAASVAIDHEGVYVATEGRSVLQVGAYEFARPGAYFTFDDLFGQDLAVLRTTDGQPVPGATIRVTLVDSAGQTTFDGLTPTDGSGLVRLPVLNPAPASGIYVVHLAFFGTSTAAPAATSRSIFLP